MTQGETGVFKNIMLDLSPDGFRLMRNQRYYGRVVDKSGRVTDAWVNCGVGGDGGSDLMGYRIVTITPDMVGWQMAQFAVVETKIVGGHKREEQKRFIDRVLADGGFGCFATSAADVKKALTNWRNPAIMACERKEIK